MEYDADQTIWYWVYTCKRCGYTNVFFTHYEPEQRTGRVSPEYAAWIAAKARCYNRKDKNYRHFGGRGIIMCHRWRYSFKLFLEDMGRRPHGTTLVRVNDAKGYDPGNCRWATPTRKPLNRRTVTAIESRT